MKKAVRSRKFYILNKTFFFLMISGWYMLGCGDDKSQMINADILIDTIVWDNFINKEIDVFPSQKIIKSEKYINLDFDEDYLFGAADKVLFLENIYVLDKRQKKIVVFDQEGKGLYTIHNIGQGPEEYLQITDFSVGNEGIINIIDGVSDKLMVFDENGKYIHTKKLPFEADIIHCLPNRDYVFGLSTWNMQADTKGKRLVVTDENLDVKNQYLDFDGYHDDAFWISFYRFVSNDSRLIYNKPIDDLVYVISGDGALEKAYFFDFGQARIPNDWRKDIESNINNIQEGYRCLKNHTIITDKYIIGTLWDRTETKPFVVDRQENIVYRNKNIVESDISDIVDFRNNSIISLIYLGKYDDNEMNLPKEVKHHLENDNFVLRVTELM